jgi:hypothetical protein
MAHLCGMSPGKLHVCHSCDHPWCMNPRHFWLGTPKQNAADRERKGRGGIRNKRSTLWLKAMRKAKHNSKGHFVW